MKLKVEFSPAEKHVDGRGDVVLIHGTGSSAMMWTPQIKHLNALGHDCYSLNLRGHGGMEDPLEMTDLAVHTGDVLDTLADSQIRTPAIFLGHSLGAIIGITLAQTHPELVSAVFAAGLPGKVYKSISLLFRIFMRTGFDTIKSRNYHKNWAFRPRTLIDTDRHSLEQIMHNFADVDFVNNVPTVKCPVFLSAGRFDPVAPCIYSIQLHKKLPESTLEIFELAGHNFMDTHPRKFNAWLTRGLDTL